MTHTLSTMTRYAGIVLGNVFFSRPTYDPIFVIPLLFPLFILPTHAILLLFVLILASSLSHSL